MNKQSNNKGMALVFTLIFIVIISSLSLVLFFKIVNTTKQISATGNNIEAMHLAKMGDTYYTQYIKHELKGLEPSESINQLKKQIEQLPLEKRVVEIEDNNKSFSVDLDRNNNPIEIDGENTIKINFISKGTAYNNVEEIKNHFTITVSEGNE